VHDNIITTDLFDSCVLFFFPRQFTKISGGLDGGAEPPAFQRAEMKRKKAEAEMEESCSNFSLFDDEAGQTIHVIAHHLAAYFDPIEHGQAHAKLPGYG
jgi:hypothetical protein